MWKVTAYKNTGINSVNTIDKPARLSAAEHIDFPAFDILQAEFLDSIRVKATREQIKDVDFIALQNSANVSDTFFYSVESFTSTSMDVQVLSITFDALLTLEFMENGIENIKFLDGITERHHVAKSADVYGAYTEDDPLLVPSKELEFIEKSFYQASGIGGTVIRSTVDLSATADSDEATTYTDAGGNSVTVPTPAKALTSSTVFGFKMGTGQSVYSIDGVAMYDGENAKTQKGIERLRNLGIEQSAITASYRMLKNVDYVETHSGTDSKFDTISGVYEEGTIGDEFFAFDYDKDVKNKRVLYGNCNMYEMISTSSGMRITFKPEDLCIGPNGETLKAPIAFRVTDPRPEGRPYYGFKYFKGVDQAQFSYFANSVAGSQWASSPLVYTGMSGASLAEIRYNTEMEGARLYADQSTAKINAELTKDNIRRVASFAMGSAALLSSGVNGNYERIPGQLRDLAGQAFTNTYERAILEEDAAFQKAQLEERYAYNARKELMELKLGTTIVAPEIHFPNSDTLRDFLGNGIYIIQYRPRKSDRAKLDKILEMYGYKDTKPLEASDFTNRSKFNYVQANSVTIGGTAPKWIREAAKEQISNGVRVWHQLPDVTAYSDGTNV